MWVGRGLWFNMGFYQHFEQRYGAVFVWSMYLAVAADAYLRYGDDPLRTLAARFAAFGDQINMPPWSSEWYLKEARHNRDRRRRAPRRRRAAAARPFITRALEGGRSSPSARSDAHNVDQRAGTTTRSRRSVSRFVEERSL
jgi:hypothetical protein